MHLAQAAAADAHSPPRLGWTLVVALMALSGAAVLSIAGVPFDPGVTVVLAAAVAATELLRIDLPDRRGVSLAALPVLLAAAGAPAGALWAAGLGTLAAAILQRRSPRASTFLFGRAVLAAVAAVAVSGWIAPGRLGEPDPAAAAVAAVPFVLTYAGVSELAASVERRAVGQPNPSHVDLVLSLGLVPIALATWVFQERAGTIGTLVAGGGLLAILLVARSAVNISTRHSDLEGLYALARQVEAGGSPEASVDVLARGLPRWVPFDALALALPSNGQLRLVAVRDPERLIPPDWQPLPEIERAAADGPTPLASTSLGLPAGAHALAARYGRRGVLLLARRRPFRPDDRAILGLLLGQLSPTLEQVRLLDEIDHERQKLDVLLASSGEGMVVLDPAGRIARVNGAFEAQVEVEAPRLLGRRLEEVFPFADRADVRLAELLAAVEPGAPLMTEGSLVTGGGRERDVLLSYASVRDADGRQGGIGIVRDVTAMKQAQRERDDFINVMTHDLRQPLAGILGYAQLLERALQPEDGESKLVKYATGVRTGGERMLRMINNLLELARMETGRVQIERMRVDVGALIDDVVQTLAAEAAQKGLRLETALPPRLPPLETSEPLLRECLANLIGNAVKYTPAGSVAVRALTEAPGIAIAIADTGIGVPPDALPRLFDRFFRTGQPEVRQLRGSGLGLALTKMMVEKLGGTIEVASTLGEGTTFTLRLPLTLPTEAA